jgi:hypothetical protein
MTKKASTPFDGDDFFLENDPPPSSFAGDHGGDDEAPPPFKNLEASRFEEPPPRPCVGCGYCCLTAQCWFSIECFGELDDVCPSLVNDGERFRCAQVGSERLRQMVAIGAGCCSPLNSRRRRQIFCDLVVGCTPSPKKKLPPL